MNKYKIVDLFAGAGGLSLGFLSTEKFKIEMAVELNKHAQETYYENNRDVRIRGEDIVEVIKQINIIKDKLGEVDVVTGGPPCQGFSNANRQKNHLISNNNQLVKEYVKFIQAIKPKIFVFENVKTILSDKHKFFVEKRDKELIENLNLEVKSEEISIGAANDLTKLLVNYVNEHGMDDVGRFAIKKEIFTELNTIIKNETKSMIKINKLKGLISKWDEYHEEFYNLEYKRQWSDIKESYGLGDFINSLNGIKSIIEVQKVINKLGEIFTHEIEASYPKIRNNSIFISLKTYNVYKFLLESFKKAGYVIDGGILNAINFGVPQSRERLIIIGVKDDIIKSSNREVRLPEVIVNNKEEYTTVFNAIGDLEALEPDKNVNYNPKEKRYMDTNCPKVYSDFVFDSTKIYNHINTSTRKVALNRFKQLSEGENFHNLKKEHQGTYTNPARTQNTIYQRLKYSSQAGTVVNVRKSMWIHPKVNRALSVREAARLQSFPDSYVFKGTKDAQYQQVGNAVPPLLGKAIANIVLELLDPKSE